MATRMQQRRGTSEQWSTANPVLAAGEIGYETDTNEFRIGDGVNHWEDLSPFKNLADLGGTLDDYVPLTQKGTAGGVATLDQFGSIPVNQLPNADALDAEVDEKVSAHNNLTQGIHGIDDTSNLATVSWTDTQIGNAIDEEITNRDAAIEASAESTFTSASTFTTDAIAEEVTNRNAAIAAEASTTATAILNAKNAAITDAGSNAELYTDNAISALSSSVTDDIATAKEEAIDAAADDTDSKISTEVQNRNTAISTHNAATTSVHGIADTSALATKVYADNAVSAHESDTTSIHGIADTSALATKSYADNAVSTHEQDTTNIHGIADTSALATKTYADNAASTAVAAAIDAAPAALDTLNELAAALGDDANYATTVTNALALKAPLASPTFTGTVSGITKAMVGLDNVENTADLDKPISTDTQSALDLKAPLESPTFTGTVAGITKSMVGLNNVDNTSDADKPISDDTQTALDLKAPKANPTFTGTVSGITKGMVGLGNVDNTADSDKPVSSATQTALDLKANLAGPTFTGTTTTGTLIVDGDLTVNGTNFTASATSITIEDNIVQLAHQNSANTVDLGLVVAYNDGTAKHSGIVRDVSDSKWKLFKGVTSEPTTTVNFTQGSLDDLAVAGFEATSATIGNVSNTELQYLDGVTSAIQTQIDAKAPLASPTFTGTVSGVTKAMVGLGSVDNTSDANKPVSTATQTALDDKAPIASPTFTGTVSGITKSMVGLGSVDNTSDTAKPISTATQTALDAKAPLASPALTGTPTAPTASAGTNTTQVATTAFVGTAVANLVASAPSTLDTLNELATALGNDAAFSTTVTTNLGLKAPKASPSFTGGVTVDSSGIIFTDGTQTKEGVPSRTPILQKSGSYTLSALTERDNMIEVSSATAVTITIPANSAVAYPVGTSIDILQTSTGQVTIAGAAGVTVNATPGLKLRTQWSACTLFKRASDTWVVYGDLSA